MNPISLPQLFESSRELKNRRKAQILGVIIFEWEINIRRSAILGLVGAGGLGLVFFRQMNTFNFHGVTSVIISILGIIVIGEFVSHKMRKRVI